jgi:hypothetical protein
MSQTCKKSGRIDAKPQASMAKEGGSSMSTLKSEHDTSSNEEQFDITSSKWQQQIVLFKKGVHNLQNASST